jgi:GLPGLI family protein
MKKSIFINTILLLMVSISISAQNFQGKIYYSSKSKVHSVHNMDNFTDEQKAATKKQQAEVSAKKYVLEFNKNHSLFTEDIKLSLIPTRPMRTGGGMDLVNSPGNFYKDLVTRSYVNQKDLFGKQFIIQDELETIAWQKTDEVKNIGEYVCFKAIAQVANTNKYDDDDNQDETITVVAWYTLDICSKIELSKTDDIEIKAPKAGKKITTIKFDKIFAQKLQDLRDRHAN